MVARTIQREHRAGADAGEGRDLPILEDRIRITADGPTALVDLGREEADTQQVYGSATRGHLLDRGFDDVHHRFENLSELHERLEAGHPEVTRRLYAHFRPQPR
jgi:hypothetical protein